MSNSVVIFTAPPGMPVPDALRNGPIVGIGGVYAGPPDAGERALAPLRAYGPPSADIYQAMPYSAAQTMADFLWPKGSLNYWKSGYLTAAPSDNAFATILGWYATVPSPRTVMVIEHNGDGAMSRVGEHETAFGNRTYPYNFLVTSVWTDPAESDTNIRWTREFWEAMRPFIADAAYVNYLGDQGEEMVRLAYGSKYAQLARVKAKYDPTNFFCMNQNIKPTRTTSAAIT
jgi:FAD/FMN-containing dehydrogenase